MAQKKTPLLHNTRGGKKNCCLIKHLLLPNGLLQMVPLLFISCRRNKSLISWNGKCSNRFLPKSLFNSARNGRTLHGPFLVKSITYSLTVWPVGEMRETLCRVSSYQSILIQGREDLNRVQYSLAHSHS